MALIIDIETAAQTALPYNADDYTPPSNYGPDAVAKWHDKNRAAVAKALEETVLPNLSEHLTVSFMTTPQDFQDNLLSYQGAAFGLEPLLLQSAWFRPHNLSEDIQNLFMVGASTHPGAGIPGVLMSAKALETVLPDAATFRQPLNA